MKVYITSNDIKKAKHAALLVREVFRLEVASDWHDVADAGPPRAEQAEWKRLAETNLARLSKADVVLCVPHPFRPGVGTYLEVGYAVKAGIPVVLLSRQLPSGVLHGFGVTHIKSADVLDEVLRSAVASATKPKKTRRKATASPGAGESGGAA